MGKPIPYSIPTFDSIEDERTTITRLQPDLLS